VTTLLDELRGLLEEPGLSPDGWLSVLDRILLHFEASAGTIHRLESETNRLNLVAQRGIPATLMGTITSIPVGKGMAGLAAARREPVQVCNLQTDASGAARPGAKLTGMEGSITVPVLVDGQLVGTLGIGKPIAHTFSRDEVDLLEEIAGVIGKLLPLGG
jgi:signal transduction protein with GAF and PtsI domain